MKSHFVTVYVLFKLLIYKYKYYQHLVCHPKWRSYMQKGSLIIMHLRIDSYFSSILWFWAGVCHISILCTLKVYFYGI